MKVSFKSEIKTKNFKNQIKDEKNNLSKFMGWKYIKYKHN